MANAKKLPSGNWRVKVYSHTTSEGKKIYESFTAPSKAEAEMMAAKFSNDKDRKRSLDLTAKEAMETYMKKNKNVLSESSLYGYELAYNRLKFFHDKRIRKLNSTDMQALISELIDKGYSPKTIKNTYGFLKASVAFCGVEQTFRVHLPSTVQKPLNSPEDEQIIVLYKNASEKMKIAILLGCLSLRRGEVAALKYKDLKGNILTIHADMVWGRDREWHYKDTPKTDASFRQVYLPDILVEMIGKGNPEAYILNIKPNAIGNSFLRLKKKVGVDIRFHDLRHYFASLAKILGVPDNYTANLGGWRNGSKVLKETYQNNIVSMNEHYADKINEHLKKLVE